MGGVFALYFIIFTIGYVVYDQCLHFKEHKENIERSQKIEQYVKEHTDPELESRCRAALIDQISYEARYDDIYERIEKYKKENGELYLRFQDGIWRDVGYKRIDLWPGGKFTPGGVSKDPNDLLYRKVMYNNMTILVTLWLNTYDVMSEVQALKEAEKLYPMPQAKAKRY